MHEYKTLLSNLSEEELRNQDIRTLRNLFLKVQELSFSCEGNYDAEKDFQKLGNVISNMSFEDRLWIYNDIKKTYKDFCNQNCPEKVLDVLRAGMNEFHKRCLD